MFATFVTLALFALPAIQGVAAEFTVNTPKSITACKDITFTWTKSVAPYNLLIVESAAPCGDILADLGDTNNTWLSWDTITIPAAYIGKDLTLSIEDGNGEEGWSGSIAYQSDGAGNTCLVSASPNNATATPGITTVPAANAEATAVPVATTSAAVAVGAANAGGTVGGAPSTRQMSSGLLAVGAFAGLLAFSL